MTSTEKTQTADTVKLYFCVFCELYFCEFNCQPRLYPGKITFKSMIKIKAFSNNETSK